MDFALVQSQSYFDPHLVLTLMSLLNLTVSCSQLLFRLWCRPDLVLLYSRFGLGFTPHLTMFQSLVLCLL